MTRERPGRLVLLGHPVAHSLSPTFQNAALQAAGIPLTYEALDVAPAALDAALASLRASNAAGNVTVPHKEAVARRCARLTPVAARCGAVNVFWHESGSLVGDNTDVGAAELTARMLLHGAVDSARVTVLGAGGAAAAMLAAAEGWGGARVQLYNRHMARAHQLAERFTGLVTVASSVDAALAGAQLVVNATPIGLSDDGVPVPVERLPSGAAVFDMVYRDGESAWVRAARAAGHWSADGRAMLIEQGALAFERWFGLVPDRNVMWTSVS